MTSISMSCRVIPGRWTTVPGGKTSDVAESHSLSVAECTREAGVPELGRRPSRVALSQTASRADHCKLRLTYCNLHLTS